MKGSHFSRLRRGSAAIAFSACAFFPSASFAQTASAPAQGASGLPSSPAPAPNESKAATSASSSGQSSGPAPGTAAPDDIIVSARRRDERLLDVPVAITAVSGARLNQYAVTTVTDLAAQVPSLLAGKAASGSSASIFLRGVGSSSLSAGFDQSVSFVIDNLAMSRGREISLPQFDIQRVEVLKGPQALFFGKNTTGGLISVSSNNPTDKFEAGIKGGYEFYARQRYVEGYVSGPITETIKARLAARYSNSDGAFTNTAADSYTNYIPGQFRTRAADDDRRGRAETVGVRGTVVWEPSSNASFNFKAGYSSVQDGGASDLIERVCGGGRTTPLPANGLPPSPNADCAVNGKADQSSLPTQVAEANFRYARDGEEYGDFKSHYAILTANITSDPFDLTSVSGYYHFRQTDLVSVAGEGYPASFSELSAYSQYSEEVRLQSKFDSPLNVLFGAFYAHGNTTFNSDAYIAPVPLDPVTGTYDAFKRNDGFTTDSLSGFAQAQLKLGSKIEIDAGGRYSLESRNSFEYSLPANAAFAAVFPGNILIRDRYRDHNLSPEATVRWKPDTNTTLYASYKQGFKAGGFNISQSITPGASDATGRFGSEKAKGEEVGLRTQLFGRRLSFSVTGYNYNYTDLQVQVFDPVTISNISGNAGKLTTRGVEGELNYRIPHITGLSVHASGAYNDAKYHNYIGSCYSGQTIAEGCSLTLVNGAYTAQNYSGRTAPKAPHLAGRAGTTFEFPLTSSGIRGVFNGDVSYTSHYNYSDALEPFAVQRSYAKVDASLSISAPNDRWTLSVIGRNLTNKLVITSANDIPFTGGTGTGTTAGVPADLSAFIDNPREVFVELAFKF